jgi:hypothetical protein
LVSYGAHRLEVYRDQADSSSFSNLH